MTESAAITPETHRRMAEDVSRQMQPLLQQLRKLRSVHLYHLEQAGVPVKPKENGKPHVITQIIKMERDCPWHLAARTALRALDKPAKIGQMADWLQARGFKPDLKRRLLFNGLYVALKRRDDMFEQRVNSEWALRQSSGDE